MGFVLLGLMTLNQIGVTGAVLQMFSHGIIAGLLFAIVGRIVYDRTHTRQFAELETMHLGKRLPFAAWAFVIAGMASMGLPGFSGFVAELQVLVGAWIAKPWWTIAAGVGIVIGVAYTWRALQKAFFSDRLPTALRNIPRPAGPRSAPSPGPKSPASSCWSPSASSSASIREFFSTPSNQP